MPIILGKTRKHKKSLWKDSTLIPRELNEERDGDIFKIIMPWVAEKEEEEKRQNQQMNLASTKAAKAIKRAAKS